jgi:hypothetical protein
VEAGSVVAGEPLSPAVAAAVQDVAGRIRAELMDTAITEGRIDA